MNKKEEELKRRETKPVNSDQQQLGGRHIQLQVPLSGCQHELHGLRAAPHGQHGGGFGGSELQGAALFIAHSIPGGECHLRCSWLVLLQDVTDQKEVRPCLGDVQGNPDGPLRKG